MATATQDAPKTRKAPRVNVEPKALTKEQAAEILAQFPFYFDIVPIEQMFVDRDYQRDLTSFVEQVINKFNPALVMTLCLSLRSSGKYAVIDGQTRMVGTEKLGFTALPALVYTGLSKAEEAQIFELIQTQRRQPTGWTRFRASLVGKNPQSMAIVGLVNEVGMTIGPAPTDIRSVAALEYGYRADPFTLSRGLVALHGAWPETPPPGQFIRAIHYFLTRNPNIDDERLERQLKLVGMEDLSIRAAHLRASKSKVQGSGATKYLAQAIKNAYNQGL